MRIIGGKYRRARLKTPRGGSVRPTTDRVREALFNVLQARISLEGMQVLDLFAGTGALGLEAISRGAEHVLFVEADRSVLRLAKENAQMLGAMEACTFVQADALKWLSGPSPKSFDLIFADPPYQLAGAALLPSMALMRLTDGGLLVLEHDARHNFGEEQNCVMSRAYGQTVISMFKA